MTATAEENSAAAKRGEREIAATRVFDAPRELVFRMWTDAEHIAQWWGPKGFTNTIHSMDVRPGGTWEFVMHGPDGTDYKNRIVYSEIVAPERIAYSHVSGPVFDVTVTFEDLGDKTKIEMRMIFHSGPERDKVVEQFGAVDGLTQTLDRLEEKVAKMRAADQPFVISRVFDAPRDLVFQVWTEPGHLSRWWGPKDFTVLSAKNDPRPGGIFHYSIRSPAGDVIWGKWVYREIVVPERLVFVSSFSDEAGNLTRHPMAPQWPIETLSTIRFDEVAGKTRITVEWIPINASDAEREVFSSSHASMQGGWSGTFEQLGGYLAAI